MAFARPLGLVERHVGMAHQALDGFQRHTALAELDGKRVAQVVDPQPAMYSGQLLRLLGNSPLQVEVTLLHTASHESVNTPEEHLVNHYKSFAQVRRQKFDGLIITGAPVEQIDFEEVDYWSELKDILDWADTNVSASLNICWGAQAALYHRYGIPKYPLPEKMFGIFPHRVLEHFNKLMRGFDDIFPAPHSRHTEVRESDILKVKSLKLAAVSDEAGVYMAVSDDGRMIFVTGHPEYDRLTLKAEYDRDVAKGLQIAVPRNYFPADDPKRDPMVTWRSHAHLLYSNWLNYCVYQGTPFDLKELPRR